MQINEVVVGNLTRDKIKQVLADYRAGKAPDYQQLPYSTNDFRIYKQSPADLVLLDNVGRHRSHQGRGLRGQGRLRRPEKSGDQP